MKFRELNHGLIVVHGLSPTDGNFGLMIGIYVLVNGHGVKLV